MSRWRRVRLWAAARRRSRVATEICFRCAQSVSPEWPFALLWPFLRLALASAIFHLAFNHPLQRSWPLRKGRLARR